MTTEHDAFEACIRDLKGDYSNRDVSMMFWAWKASRKVALEEAVSQFNQGDGAWPVSAVINTIKGLK